MAAIWNSDLNNLQRFNLIGENQCTNKIKYWASAEMYKRMNRENKQVLMELGK
jgi:hypothetical protein